ncbi:MAG: hypothetical protein V4466_12635 [Pseudomonadota bacterium]
MKLWKTVFALAAAFNLLVGLPLLLAPAAFLKLAGGSTSPDLLSAQMSGLLIAVFGVGYAMIAVNPVANRPIAWLGVFGKTPLILLVWLQVRAGHAPPSSLGLPAVDLVFAALFLAFLLRTRRMVAT